MESERYRNNAGFFGKATVGTSLETAFRRYCVATENKSPSVADALEFGAARDISLGLVYRLGEIVQVKKEGKFRFARVVGYFGSTFYGIECVIPTLGRETASFNVDPEDPLEYKVAIPEDFYDFVRAEVRAEEAKRKEDEE